MNIIINTLLILDGLVLLMVFLDSLSKKEPQTMYKHQIKAMDKVTEKSIRGIENEKSKSSQIAMTIGAVLGFLFFSFCVLSFFAAPIYFWVKYDFSYGLLAYVILSSFYSTYLLKSKIKKLGVENMKESQPVFVVISNLFRLLLLIVVYFGFNSNFQESMIKIYENFTNFNYLFMVLYPVLIIGISITNIYALFNGLMLFRKDQPMKNEWRTSIKDILLIFVISSFIGTIYLADNKLTFVEEADMVFVNQNIEIVKIFLTAIFIPLLFDKIISEKGFYKQIDTSNLPTKKTVQTKLGRYNRRVKIVKSKTGNKFKKD